jgi:hypothetical protein
MVVLELVGRLLLTVSSVMFGALLGFAVLRAVGVHRRFF